jgi:phosphoribosylglycinamide formyltransferase 1
VVAAGVLISGRGSNLQAIIERVAAGGLDCRLVCVISNRPEAEGLDRARATGIATQVIDHRGYPHREDYDRAVVDVLRRAEVDLVALAGFDRLVTPVLIDAFRDRLMNVHPALLPVFKGLHAQRQALAYGVRIAGATVHFVDEDMDHGPIILQGATPVGPDDDEHTLARRILRIEHRIFPEAMQLFAEGRLHVEGRHVVIDHPPPFVFEPLG